MLFASGPGTFESWKTKPGGIGAKSKFDGSIPNSRTGISQPRNGRPVTPYVFVRIGGAPLTIVLSPVSTSEYCL